MFLISISGDKDVAGYDIGAGSRTPYNDEMDITEVKQEKNQIVQW